MDSRLRRLGARREDSGSSSARASGVASLFRNDKYADLVLSCRGRVFNVHRAIVCPQSDFFDRACSGHFKEAAERRIDLPDDYPDILDKFLEFLYTGQYSDVRDPEGTTIRIEPDQHVNSSQHIGNFQLAISGFAPDDHHPQPTVARRSSSDSNYGGSGAGPPHSPSQGDSDFTECLLTSLRVFVMADKYLVEALRGLALKRFKRVAAYQSLTAPGGFAQVAEELFETTSGNESEVGEEMPDVAAVTDEAQELRDFVCRRVAEEYWEPRVRRNFRGAMLRYPELAVGVLDRMASFLYS